jgi:cell division protein ZipA
MEADGLRWSLLIIGSLVIVGLAVHGIWISRKNSEKKTNAKKRKSDQQYQPSGWQSESENFDDLGNELNEIDQDLTEDSNIKFDMGIDDEPLNLVAPEAINNDFDDLGIGAVRVVSSEPKEGKETESVSETTVDEDIEPILTTNIQAEPETSGSKIYASVVTQPKPEYAAKYSSLAAETVAISQQERATANETSDSSKVHTPQFTAASNNGINSNDNYQAPEPPPFLLKKEVPEPTDSSDNESIATKGTAQNNPQKATEQPKLEEKPHATLAEKLSLSEQARNLVKRKKSDTVRKRREPKIAEDQMRIDFDDDPITDSKPKAPEKAKPAESEQPQEVLVLNVKSADDNPIPGSALLPMLLTLGFKFGDQDIFHRHVNSNGKGPVLFSLANMFKPGNFDIDNLENFTTQGISLFMILPIEGEPHQVFNMMHNAARKIAEEFSAQVYDGTRTLLSKQSLQQYVEKIREFERQRLIKG